jgi:hypothetical protein
LPHAVHARDRPSIASDDNSAAHVPPKSSSLTVAITPWNGAWWVVGNGVSSTLIGRGVTRTSRRPAGR